jgi:2-amino-4-hydroxy-6-hydroxymethyldihydropteridine diphosphokinase
VTRFALSLGSNLPDAAGDSPAILADAVARLAAADGVRIVAVSSLYRTAPEGGVAQPDFFNAVVVGDTTLGADALLTLCQAVEAAHHRTREVRWGPRTLDIDVLAFGDEVSDAPALTLPHPRAHERAFVLVPWAEVDADAHLVGRGRVADLADAVGTDGVRLAGLTWPARPQGGRRG